MKQTLLFLISFFFTTTLVSAQCQSPTFPGVNNITDSSAVIFWQDVSTTTAWNIEISINGVSASQINATTNPFVLNGLACDSNITVTISSICTPTEISSPITITFLTAACNQGPGQPQSYSACLNGAAQACFNLTDNDVNLMGSLNPAEHVISYHLTNDDANNNVNQLSSPYCVGLGVNQPVYARVSNTSNGNSYISVFFLSVTAYNYSQPFLAPMEQCDQDNNGNISFDLTSAEAQLNTTNTLAYYASQSDAENQVNAISNVTSYTLPVSPLTVPIFIRENIPNSCDTIYTMNLRTFANCNLASVCSLANSLCGALGNPFQNTINVPNNGALGCLGTTPNPTWFYLPVSTTGNISLMIQQSTDPNFGFNNLDVDYAVFGPFTDPVTPCNGQITPNTIVSCSYSNSAVETATIANAIAGQYYLIMVTNFSNQPGYIKISDIGTSQGTIDCSGIRLNAFLDANANGTQDNGENNFPLGQFQYELNNDGVIHNISSPVGTYNIYETNAANSYDFNYSIDPAYAAMFNITTSSYTDISVVVGAGMTTYNFPITVNQPYNDLAIAIIPVSAPRPGFTYINKLVYANLGNQTIASGTVSFTKDPNVSIASISQSGTNPTPSGFTYDFTNLLPFEAREITVSMLVPTIPTVNAGQYLTNSATIIPLSGDIVPENNDNTLSQMVINAYDPNDKMESHGEEILHSSFTAEYYLYYTLRFENTGNASEINVRINDVLDAKLDESTITMVDASHSYVLDRVGTNLTWNFDDIMLPVSVANTTIGKGYVMFKVKPKAGYAVGDIIPNTASIYFDFNPAIVTNTFNTEFVAALGTNSFESNQFGFYPNPAKDYLTVTSNTAIHSIKSIVIYDVLGKVVLTKQVSNTEAQTVNIAELNAGVYMIEITSNNNVKVMKKLMVE